MFFRLLMALPSRIVRRLLAWRGWASEEEAFAEDLRRLDEESPGWDRPGRVAACAALLKAGADASTLREIYGDDIFRDAQARLEQQ